MSKKFSHTIIKSMLIAPPNSFIGTYNVGSWLCGKSLLYTTFKKFECGNLYSDMKSLIKNLEKMNEQLIMWGILQNSKKNDFVNYAYSLVSKNWEVFWPNLVYHNNEKFNNDADSVDYKLNNMFSIKRENLDDFVSILWFSVKKYTI